MDRIDRRSFLRRSAAATLVPALGTFHPGELQPSDLVSLDPIQDRTDPLPDFANMDAVVPLPKEFADFGAWIERELNLLRCHLLVDGERLYVFDPE